MGFLPCPLPCPSYKESDSHNQEDCSKSSLSSQPSLPSVPSLTPTPQQPSTTHHRCLSTLKGHSSYVFSLAVDGNHLYSGSSDSQIRLWSLDSTYHHNYQNSTDDIIASTQSAVKSIVILGDKLFSAHHDHKIRVWKIEKDVKQIGHQKLKCLANLPTLNNRVMSLFSAGNYVKVRRHKKCTWVHHVDTISALALSTDGSLLYSVSWDRTLKIWRTSDFKCLESVFAHDDAINSVAVSNDGLIYTGSADRKIKVWKKENGDKKKHGLVATLEKHKSAVNALALSPDGSVLYSGACDRSIIVWEKDGSGGGGYMVVAGALRGHTKAILCLAVVGNLVCSGSADKSVRIWRRGFGNSYCCLAVLEGHKGPVKCLGVDFGGTYGNRNPDLGSPFLVYSGSLDCDIKVWQVCLLKKDNRKKMEEEER